MAKSFRKLVKQTSNKQTKKIAKKRTKQLVKSVKSKRFNAEEIINDLEQRIIDLTKRIEYLELNRFYESQYPKPKYWPNTPTTPFWTYQ